MFVGLKRTNTTFAVNVQGNGYSMLSWPFDQSQTESANFGDTNKVGWGFLAGGKGGAPGNGVTAGTGDQLWISSPTGGAFSTAYTLLSGFGSNYDGQWWDSLHGVLVSNVTMQAGSAFFYQSRGTSFTWQATSP